jgi:S-adenosylmethionine/arginine decarboxylase-like enzyme
MRSVFEAEAPAKLRQMPIESSNSIIDETDEEDFSHIMEDAIEKSAWGVAASIDIYDCDPDTIRSASKIRKFVVELCDLIEMKRFGRTTVVNFGEDERVAGYSMTQLIETSLISAHFANLTNTTYLDVFSCKPYDPRVARDFAVKFFGGSRCVMSVNLRL